MNVLTARVDGYFYLGLTKQNMTCHYFDFFLQNSAVLELVSPSLTSKLNSLQWSLCPDHNHIIIFLKILAKFITQTPVVVTRLGGCVPLFATDAVFQAISHLSRLTRLPWHRKAYVLGLKNEDAYTCKPKSFWMSSWHRDSSFSLELLASSIWGFTTKVGWMEAALNIF